MSIVGIDLGTTNSVVAVMEGRKPVVIPDRMGNRIIPSVMAFTEDNECVVGHEALKQAAHGKTVYPMRRFMERPKILGLGLQKLKNLAENHLGEKVTDAVVTVPVYFDHSQRQAIKDAGRVAGLYVGRLVSAPTAAALAYGLDKKTDETIAVYDFGGGTFDISILDVGDNVVEVKATNGDTHLGGENFDQRIIDWLVDEFKRDQDIDLSGDATAMQRLKEAAEKAKCELSSVAETEINLPFITADASGPKHLLTKLSRARFEQMIEDLVKRSIEPCERALKDANLAPSDIDEVVLVGGSTRIPLVQQEVERLFGKAPSKRLNPDEVVVLGAAVQGGVLAGDVKDVLLMDVTPLSLGIESLGGAMTRLIERNTTFPKRETRMFTTTADNQPIVEIHVLEGEGEVAQGNRTLGRFHLEGIPAAPRGVPKIAVTLGIDADGTITVNGEDLGGGAQKRIVAGPQQALKTENSVVPTGVHLPEIRNEFVGDPVGPVVSPPSRAHETEQSSGLRDGIIASFLGGALLLILLLALLSHYK